MADLDASKVALWLDDVQVAEGGLMSSSYTEAAGSAVLAQDEFKVTIDLGRGEANQTVWTTDLSYEYVRINAEYRSWVESSSNSGGSSPGILCSSLAQAPKSISRQRSEQNGRNGLAGVHLTRF